MALDIDSNGEARATDVREHTAELGGASQLANVSSFGIDADGDLILRRIQNEDGRSRAFINGTLAAGTVMGITCESDPRGSPSAVKASALASVLA